MLPIKTTTDDLEILTRYLVSQVGWVELDKLKSAVPSKHADNRKVEATRYLGLIERDGSNIKLTDAGREYSGGDESRRAEILRERIRAIPLYNATVQWLHFSRKDGPDKTEIANYWHDNHSGSLEGATGAALTDGVIFFMRIADAAGLGQFISAGKGRPVTYFKTDSSAVEQFATGAAPAPPNPTPAVTPTPAGTQTPASPPPPATGPITPSVTTSPAVHINVEIHIAADAKPSTVEEVFKNMRKYVLNDPTEDDE